MSGTERKVEQNQQRTICPLNDDRRVKTLSPGVMVTKRFFQNRIAVFGTFILIAMFLFSFVGGAISPYGEPELSYRTDKQTQKYAGVEINTEPRYQQVEKSVFPALAQAQFVPTKDKGTPDFTVGNVQHSYEEAGKDFYVIYKKGVSEPIAFTSFATMASASGNGALPFNMQLAIPKAVTNQETSFTLGSDTYTVDEDETVLKDGRPYAYASHYMINVITSDATFSKQLKEELIAEIEAGKKELIFKDADDTEASYMLEYDAPSKAYNIVQIEEQRVYGTYSSPSRAYPFGTDKNGMDMLTHLMYGGRVSLYIGFIVVIIETVIGMIMGGISGYFGGWVDTLTMHVVGIFYCILNIPIYIIIGAAMDALHVDPQIRMIYLMMILGFFGWPSITRLVRGQILMFHEQEFMTAAKATGIKLINRIFRHLLPNIISQPIVTCTMSLGGVILTGATPSFLGLGIKFPFVFWGNTINDVNNTYMLSNYLFTRIPAGICLFLTVPALNLVGDGLRDVFDPRMKH